MNKCNGQCLRQAGPENIYYRDSKSTCTNNCLPVSCPNYTLCGNVYPAIYNECWRGRCVNCDIIFGCNLEFFKEANFECCICMEKKSISVKMPSCSHKFCTICFGRIHGWHSKYLKDNYKFDVNEYLWTEEQLHEYYDNLDSNDDDYEETSSDNDNNGCPICRIKHVQDWKNNH